MDGPQFPAYRVGPLCAAPFCSRPVDNTHHIWRRSFLAGPFNWVRLWDGTIIGNLSGLCWEHHNEITENKAQIIWEEQFYWRVNGDVLAPLSPQPPRHGAPVTRHTEKVAGPAAVERCGTCGRPLPHEHDEKKEKEPTRRRKSWVVLCPDDGEDGALVLDTLMDGCRDLFQHDESPKTRYFTLIQALALVVQHGEQMVSEGEEDEDVTPATNEQNAADLSRTT